MNLEDRLRSHLHSGPDMVDGSSPTAADITAAGTRRTNRNRAIAGGGIAAFTAVVLIGAAVALTGGGQAPTDEVAAPIEESQLTEGDESIIASSENDQIAEDFEEDDTFETQPEDSTFFDGPLPAFDSLVGVDGGFAGLRNRDGETTAVRSDDGVTFTEESTTGIPDGATFVELIADEGVFAVIFNRFDTGLTEQWIGTSANLVDWDLVEVDPSEGDLFQVDIENGRVIAATFATSSGFEDEQEAVDERASRGAGQLFVGPVGGPYEPRSLPEGDISQVTASGDTIVVLVDVASGRSILRSTSNGDWEEAAGTTSSSILFALNELDDNLFATGFDGSTFASTDQGATFTPVTDIPSAGSASVAGSVWVGDGTMAVYLETFADDNSSDRQLYLRDSSGWATFDITTAYDALGFGPGDFVIPMAVNDEELLLQVFPADGGEPAADPIYVPVAIG